MKHVYMDIYDFSSTMIWKTGIPVIFIPGILGIPVIFSSKMNIRKTNQSTIKRDHHIYFSPI